MLSDIIKSATKKSGMPEDWLTLLETRSDVKELLNLDQYVDLVIPRGSNEFVKYIKKNTRIPVLGHADGICHVYVAADADIKIAVDIAFDSKVQYPAVCNAMETLLVDKGVAKKYLPEIEKAYKKARVELRGDPKVQKIINCNSASEKDWHTEYNDLILSIKIVADIQEAINFINFYGSKHTDVIVTKNRESAQKFMALVDSANVFWNCSTRFSDGFRYGLGAEVGISTNKIHARGPVGLEGLIIYKWVMIGNGQTVTEYSGESSKKFKHVKLNKKFSL
jgi:glutamate-5-semialdehyde dehydrogenase